MKTSLWMRMWKRRVKEGGSIMVKAFECQVKDFGLYSPSKPVSLFTTCGFHNIKM
jgi:hypothetical protein